MRDYETTYRTYASLSPAINIGNVSIPYSPAALSPEARIGVDCLALLRRAYPAAVEIALEIVSDGVKDGDRRDEIADRVTIYFNNLFTHRLTASQFRLVAVLLVEVLSANKEMNQ